MGKDKHRILLNRARKLARLKARRKQRHGQQDQAGFRRSVHLGIDRQQLQRAPMHKVLVSTTIFHQGIGYVVISRMLPDGRVAAGVFLLDVYCLGVKNAFFTVATVPDFDSWISRLFASQGPRSTSPSYARRLVEATIAYARDLGFEPHEDFHDVAVILGDIDVSECTEVFTFGREGKPLYISGPDESEAKARRIIAMLEDRCGKDGFHYILGIPVSDQDDSWEIFQEDIVDEEPIRTDTSKD